MKRFLLPAFVILTACFTLFWNLSNQPVAEWDEARYGVNAVEMAENHDFINYFYHGQLDHWNAKPPLQVWLITAADAVMGPGEVALRMPSIIAAIVALIFLFLIVSHYADRKTAWACVFIAATSRALIGAHVARGGDMDAWFVAGLAAFSFGFIRGLEGRAVLWILAGVGLGVAFLAKGFAFLIVMPAFLFLFLKGDWRRSLKSALFWLGLVSFALFPLIWIFVSQTWGMKENSLQYKSQSAVGVMILYDMIARFNGTMGDTPPPPMNPFQIFAFMDIRFAAWYYAAIFMGIAVLSTQANRGASFAKTLLFKSVNARASAFRFAAALSLIVLVVVAVSRSKQDWYVAPLAISWPILLAVWFDMVTANGRPRARQVVSVFAALFAVWGLIQIGEYVHDGATPSAIQSFAREHRAKLNSSTTVAIDHHLRQDELLYLMWNGVRKFDEGEAGARPSTGYDLACANSICRLTTKP